MLQQIHSTIQLCGIMFYPLSFLFIVSLALIIDKFLFLRKMISPEALIDKVKNENKIVIEAKKLEKKLHSGLWILETIITAAPLLGLLGTIIGMMSSFKLIGENGLVNPSGVTAGVAESLIATAYGLVIAVFSLFAFNYFSEKKEQIMDEIEWKMNS